jgi:hypothetical protein
MKKKLITKEDLVKLLKSLHQGTSVLEAAMLKGQQRYVHWFIKRTYDLCYKKRVLQPEDIDEVMSLSEETNSKLAATEKGKELLKRFGQWKWNYLYG